MVQLRHCFCALKSSVASPNYGSGLKAASRYHANADVLVK